MFTTALRLNPMQWRIYIVKFLMRAPLGVQILLISCSFWENLAKLYVGAPRRVGTPSSGKSWIRHCDGFQFDYFTPEFRFFSSSNVILPCKKCIKRHFIVDYYSMEAYPTFRTLYCRPSPNLNN